MDVITLNAQPRTLGSSAARAARRAGEVPCVLYGPNQEPVHFQVPILDLRPLIYTDESHRVSISLGGESYDCIPRHVDFDPLTDFPAHVDFYALTAGMEVTLTVPVALVGDPAGVRAGGILSQILNELEIRCLPKDIPNQIELDISELEMGDALHVSDLDVENVTILTDDDRTVVTITAPISEEELEEDLAVEGEEDVAEEEVEESTDEEPEE